MSKFMGFLETSKYARTLKNQRRHAGEDTKNRKDKWLVFVNGRGGEN